MVGVFYPEHEFQEIEANLNKIYTLLHSDGDEATPTLSKGRHNRLLYFWQLQTFFGFGVRNILNDNYTNFYIKQADASSDIRIRAGGFTFPNRINFLIHKNTLIEEHILGIPVMSSSRSICLIVQNWKSPDLQRICKIQ